VADPTSVSTIETIILRRGGGQVVDDSYEGLWTASKGGRVIGVDEDPDQLLRDMDNAGYSGVIIDPPMPDVERAVLED